MAVATKSPPLTEHDAALQALADLNAHQAAERASADGELAAAAAAVEKLQKPYRRLDAAKERSLTLALTQPRAVTAKELDVVAKAHPSLAKEIHRYEKEVSNIGLLHKVWAEPGERGKPAITMGNSAECNAYRLSCLHNIQELRRFQMQKHNAESAQAKIHDLRRTAERPSN